MTVDWIEGDPPSNKARLSEKLAAVTERPSRWAIVGTYTTRGAASSVASRVRRGVLGPGGTWETQVGSHADGTAVLYAKFVKATEDRA